MQTAFLCTLFVQTPSLSDCKIVAVQ
uniref:RmnA n=1 Tax=Lacticaseibacillus rhamnosus TaxID=47715 RepID=Q9EYJ9_LACRH|nr:RmnA [Lacticaseibacillus rhamnosus GG]